MRQLPLQTGLAFLQEPPAGVAVGEGLARQPLPEDADGWVRERSSLPVYPVYVGR